MYYRVRKSWEDSKSQLGAYTILENAIKQCDANPGYSVFDEDGKVIHKSGTVVIRTMSYKAKLLKKTGKHAAGSKVTVTRNRKKQWVLKDGTVVNRNNLTLTKQIYDNACRYSKADAEAYVNREGFASPTDWLFWCNKYGQRVYIFKGKKGAWVLQKVFKCGTGIITSDQGVGFSWKIWNKAKAFKGPRVTQHWNMHYSSPGGNSIHQGGVGKPSTHGCIALAKKAAIWTFEALPLDTRVVVF
jgi:hypothetical protein